ncbi:hypothetical protein Tco_1264044 [Tanacetum coccineum]
MVKKDSVAQCTYGFLAGVMDKRDAFKSTSNEEKERHYRREIVAAKDDMYTEKYWAKSLHKFSLIISGALLVTDFFLMIDQYISIGRIRNLGSDWVNVMGTLSKRVSNQELSRELNMGPTTHSRLKDRIRSDGKLSLTSLSNNLSQFWKTCSFGYFGIRRDCIANSSKF